MVDGSRYRFAMSDSAAAAICVRLRRDGLVGTYFACFTTQDDSRVIAVINQQAVFALLELFSSLNSLLFTARHAYDMLGNCAHIEGTNEF
jgi:hypothetical protein